MCGVGFAEAASPVFVAHDLALRAARAKVNSSSVRSLAQAGHMPGCPDLYRTTQALHSCLVHNLALAPSGRCSQSGQMVKPCFMANSSCYGLALCAPGPVIFIPAPLQSRHFRRSRVVPSRILPTPRHVLHSSQRHPPSLSMGPWQAVHWVSATIRRSMSPRLVTW